MYHVFCDVRVSRRLTGHFLTDSKGRVKGQHRHIGDLLDQLFELTPGRVEFHTEHQIITVEILTTSQQSSDALRLANDPDLDPWQFEAELEG